MVNVTKENFIEQSNDLLRHLPTAAFVAIDEEMTGISVDKGRPPKDKMPVERYNTLKQAPERYSIIQLGVALFHPVNYGSNNNRSQPSAAQASGRGYTSVLPSHASPLRNNNNYEDDDDASTEYWVRRYNFYMFPAVTSGSGRGGDNDNDIREVVLNPATVEFLLKHNMSFDLWTSQGVPFAASSSQANALLDAYSSKERAALLLEGTDKPPATVQGTIRRRVELRRNDDIEFFARAMASLREWLDSAHDAVIDNNTSDDDDDDEEDGAIGGGEGSSFLMPPCNSFLRRALYEGIEKEYPTLVLESGGNQQIRVWRLNAEEKARRNARLRRERWEELIGKKLGVWRIFEALRCACSGIEINRSSVLFADSFDQIDWDSPAHEEEGKDDAVAANETTITTRRKIPIVVHNGFMDILFLLTHFDAAKLPNVYTDCKKLIASYFPIIYDTKVISTECNCWGTNGAGNDLTSYNTNLSNLFQQVVRERPMGNGGGNDRPLLDQIHVVEPARSSSSMPIAPDQEHEAAYDAYMTGAIFLGLCRRIQNTSTVSPNLFDVISRSSRDINHFDEARLFYSRNMLYQMSMYTMDLEQVQSTRDPMSKGMLPESTYRVAGFDKAVTTSDIVRCISGLTDSVGREIQFDIVWIDDTTFLVAASYHRRSRNNNAAHDDGNDDDEMEVILRDHGSHLFRALSQRFQQKGETIVVLEEYLRTLDAAQKHKDMLLQQQEAGHGANRFSRMMDRVLSVFGWTAATRHKRARTADAAAEDASNKRRRVNN